MLFFTYQISGVCARVCVCNCMHRIDKTVTYPERFWYQSTIMGAQICILSQWKTKNVKIISMNSCLSQCLRELIITKQLHFLVNNSYPWHPYILKTEKSPSKITIILFCVSGGFCPQSCCWVMVSPRNLCMHHWVVDVWKKYLFCQ